MKYYVLRYPNGSLVGIDIDSGGYPWEAWKGSSDDALTSVLTFPFNEYGKKQALKYCDNFDKDNFELVILECSITKVDK